MASIACPTISHSPAFTIVPTNECFNRCTYCNFRRDPKQAQWLTLTEVESILSSLDTKTVCEILILSGEVHPQSSRREQWFGLIYQICKLALALGFLPHTNAGPLSFDEMKQLKTVNLSMGLMLEQMTPRLLQTVHRNAPSKLPHLRLQQLHQAGVLGIPFTTGLLLGIGETSQDWVETLEAIALCHQKWGHIQEVILQPYQPGTQELKQGFALCPEQLLQAITLAKQHLPPEIALQVPPNLIANPADLKRCIDAGVTDLGGIVPIDHVNPDYGHHQSSQLSQVLAEWGYHLVQRLPVYGSQEQKVPKPLRSYLAPWKIKIQENESEPGHRNSPRRFPLTF